MRVIAAGSIKYMTWHNNAFNLAKLVKEYQIANLYLAAPTFFNETAAYLTNILGYKIVVKRH